MLLSIELAASHIRSWSKEMDDKKLIVAEGKRNVPALNDLPF